jgi:hypothetical protein
MPRRVGAASRGAKLTCTETIADHLRKYESLLTGELRSPFQFADRTVSAPRLRMIVNAFEETLEKGLKKEGEIVVSNRCHIGCKGDCHPWGFTDMCSP